MMESIITNLRPNRYNNLRDATAMLEKIKLACKDYIIQYKDQNREYTNLKIEHESVDAKLKRLNDENDAKSVSANQEES